MINEQNDRILHDICPISTVSPNFGGQFPAVKLRVSGLDLSTNYVTMVGIVMGAIVLNKQFMRLFTILYSVSLNA